VHRGKKRKAPTSADSNTDRPALKSVRNAWPTLYSAWKPPAPVFVRNPEMTLYSFIRTTAIAEITGEVNFLTSSETEYIEIASDWQEGEALCEAKQPFRKTGYIGRGYSKRAIYVCCLVFLTRK
jgi:hypothetical protein